MDHVRLTDELVDAARARRMRAETGIPIAQVVALNIAKRPATGRDDVLIHRLYLEITADQLELLMRITPPFPDVRLLEPAQHQRQVGRGHRAEDVGRGCHKISMVTLRLV